MATYKEQHYTQYTGKTNRTDKRYWLQFWAEQWEGTQFAELAELAKITFSTRTGYSAFTCDDMITHEEPGMYKIAPFICDNCRSELDEESIKNEEKAKQHFIPIDPDFNYTIKCICCNKHASYILGELTGTLTAIGIATIHDETF